MHDAHRIEDNLRGRQGRNKSSSKENITFLHVTPKQEKTAHGKPGGRACNRHPSRTGDTLLRATDDGREEKQFTIHSDTSELKEGEE